MQLNISMAMLINADFTANLEVREVKKNDDDAVMTVPIWGFNGFGPPRDFKGKKRMLKIEYHL